MARQRLALGIAGLDLALAGGLALGRVHMLCANWAGAHGALTGFAICLLRQLLALNDLAPNAQKPDQALHTGGVVAGRWGRGPRDLLSGVRRRMMRLAACSMRRGWRRWGWIHRGC